MIEISHPALARIWQEPEYGSAALGFAPAGPADRTSAAWANATLGNDLQTPVLEISLGANEIHFDRDCAIAWAGAPHEVSVQDRAIRARQATLVRKGERVTIKPGIWGNKIAVSTVGGWQGRCNTGLECSGATAPSVDLPDHKELLTWLPKRGHIRVTAGPECPSDWIPEHPYRTSVHTNNQGIRLIGPVPALENFGIASGPVIDGTIQATPDGLIALLRERQTVGGYPRVAQIIPSDVDIAAQLRPGDGIRFDMIDLTVAHTISQAYENSFAALRQVVAAI